MVKNLCLSMVASLVLASVMLAGTHAFHSKPHGHEVRDRFDMAVVSGRWFHNMNCGGKGMTFRYWPPSYAKSYYYNANPAACITNTVPGP